MFSDRFSDDIEILRTKSIEGDLLNDDFFERDENVFFTGETNIMFKIILEELNLERKKYLEVDFKLRCLYILKSNNKGVERKFSVEEIL